MKLSVIIVNYNVKFFLEQCLITVRKALSGIESEILVVDNHSADSSCEMIREGFPEVKLIENAENVGFSRANNQAIRIARGEYILLLNPDTVVQEETFRKCIDFMDRHPDAGALGVKMIDGKGKFLPESKRGLPTPEVALYKMLGLNKLFPRSRQFGKYHLGYLPEDETNPVDVLAGAFMFIRKSVLEKVGLLDETFFMYGEDIDLSYRITEAGYKNYYFPETSIIHYKGESTKKMSANYVFVFYRAMVIFARKHYEGGSRNFLVLFIRSAIYVRAGLALVQRFLHSTWLYFTDALLLLAGMLFLKGYWEEHIKFIESYPKELVTIHIPYYIFLWISSVYLNGGYKEPYSIRRIIRGILLGTILIAAVYGLLPNALRFSRALIILGALWAVIAMLGVRLLVHFRRYGNFNLGRRSDLRTVIVGESNERERVRSMLAFERSPVEFIGFIAISEEDHGPDVLGTSSRLDDLCEIYRIQEVIFCSKDISNTQIIHWMGRLSSKGVNFKILPDERFFVIGSNSKDATGEFYTREIHLRLAETYHRRVKRWFDILSSIILLILSPVLAFFYWGFTDYYKRCWRVLSGRRTWIGYDRSVEIGHLPQLRTGIFQVTDRSRNYELSNSIRDRLNYLYARNYSVESDVYVLLKSLISI
ncbi:MAG: glycosyltransferase [Flavobacteriales bacterium]|nr:glycosyltransferase [Flavobacteriales bacterium]